MPEIYTILALLFVLSIFFVVVKYFPPVENINEDNGTEESIVAQFLVLEDANDITEQTN